MPDAMAHCCSAHPHWPPQLPITAPVIPSSHKGELGACWRAGGANKNSIELDGTGQRGSHGEGQGGQQAEVLMGCGRGPHSQKRPPQTRAGIPASEDIAHQQDGIGYMGGEGELAYTTFQNFSKAAHKLPHKWTTDRGWGRPNSPCHLHPVQTC